MAVPGLGDGCCPCCSTKGSGQVYKPRNERWCTDILCLLLLVAAVGGLGAFCYIATSAHPDLLDSLMYPADSHGNYCGKPGTATADLPKVFFPDLDSDVVTYSAYLASSQYLTFLSKVTSLCAAECPSGVSLSGYTIYGGSSYPTDGNSTVPSYTYAFATQDVIKRCFPLSSTFAGEETELCIAPKCTNATLNATLGGTVHCAALADRPDETTTWEVCPAGASDDECAARGAACEYAVRRKPQFEYVTEESSDDSTAATQQLAESVQLVVGAYDGVLEASVEVIVCGVVLPALLGVGWCVMLWFFAGFIVYAMLLALVACMVTLSIWLCFKGGWFDSVTDEVDATATSTSDGGSGSGDASSDGSSSSSSVTTLSNVTLSGLLSEASSDEQAYYQIAAIVVMLLTAIFVLLIFFWRKCIRRAIAIVQETTKVFRTLPALMGWPLLALPFQLGFVVLGLLMVMWTMDDEVWSEVDDEFGYSLSTSEQLVVMLYCVGVCLWLTNWAKAISWTSMAAAVAYWFCTDNAPPPTATTSSPAAAAAASSRRCCRAGTGCGRLWDSTWTVVSKHLGSMAVGSFVIALCQLLRLVLHAVDRATKSQQESNLLLKLAVKCSQCAAYCLQKTVEFVSFYGYVFVAIDGSSFCRACRDTFVLVASYPSQAAVNGTVKALLGLLIAWTSPLICAATCFFVLEADDGYLGQGYEPIYAAALVFVSSYVIADSVATVFACCIDTIYLCSFKDMRDNDPPKFMSNDLREAFGIDAAEHEATNTKDYQPVQQQPGAAGGASSGGGKRKVLPYIPPPSFAAIKAV